MQQENSSLAFGEHLKSLRQQQHLTQVALSQRSGVAQSYLSALERGVVVNPSREIIGRLAEAFGICAAELEANRGLAGIDTTSTQDPDLTKIIRCGGS